MKSPLIIISHHELNPRLLYVTNFLSSNLGIRCKTEIKLSPVQDSDQAACIINYTQHPIAGALNIYASGFLNETSIRQVKPEVAKFKGLTVLFPAPPGYDLPFDMFSAIFYLISRYEEYLPFSADRYGRFEANQSLAFQQNFLCEPVVDQWLLLIKKILSNKFPDLRFPEQHFRFQPTFDVDNPWAYKYRGMLRNVSGMIRHALGLKFSAIKDRIAVLSGIRNDPYDVYAYIGQMETRYGFRSVYFFLSGNYGGFDVNYSLKSTHFRRLLHNLGDSREIGIHPSYKSNSDFDLLKWEYESFSNMLGKPVEISRQHFLILSFPETYRRLISLGVKHDYSMGYATLPGFRAGTSLPFRFYDLSAEEEKDLWIHPFLVMDVTLQQYLTLNPYNASQTIRELAEKIRSVGGIFTCLWHNESISEHGVWKGWRRVFEEMVEENLKMR